MPTHTLKTREDCEDFVRGLTIMGTGGGGQPERGVSVLLQELEAGREPGWVDADEIGDDIWTACPFLMGSIAPRTPEIEKEMALFGLTQVKVAHPMMEALRELEDFQGVKLGAIVPIELGGANTPTALASASQMGIKLVDGDYTGRAIPEIEQIAPILFGKGLTPITSVDDFGNTIIIRQALSPAMTERLGKLISVGAYGLAYQAGMVLRGSEMKDILVRNTLTKSLELGQAVRRARESGRDPVETARGLMDGWLLFKGVIVEKDWEDRVGYLWGTHTFRGVEEFEGRTFKIWYKNENHVSWLDDEPYVTSPDIMAVIDLKTGEPRTNTRLAEGDVMAVLGAKAPDQFRRQAIGVGVLGPSHFGFSDIKYRPIEEILQVEMPIG